MHRAQKDGASRFRICEDQVLDRFDRSFRPIVSSNRFKRLASVAMTVKLLGSLHCKSTFIPKSQKSELGESPLTIRGIPAVNPPCRVSPARHVAVVCVEVPPQKSDSTGFEPAPSDRRQLAVSSDASGRAAACPQTLVSQE